jgi:hypothetical protein
MEPILGTFELYFNNARSNVNTLLTQFGASKQITSIERTRRSSRGIRAAQRIIDFASVLRSTRSGTQIIGKLGLLPTRVRECITNGTPIGVKDT